MRDISTVMDICKEELGERVFVALTTYSAPPEILKTAALHCFINHEVPAEKAGILREALKELSETGIL